MSTGSRGQALLETTIALPLFLLGLFGVMWAVTEGSLVERTQLGARYGGTVGALADPYTHYSLYSLYGTLDNGLATPPPSNCEVGMTNIATGSRSAFFSPASGAPPVANCLPSTIVELKNAPGEPFSQNVYVQSNRTSFESSATASGYLANVLVTTNGSTKSRAIQNFFRSPDVGLLAACTPLGSVVKSSLEPGSADQTPAPNTAPTPFSSQLPSTPLDDNNGTCKTFSSPSPGPAVTP